MSMISNDWLAELGPEFKKPYYAQLYEFVKNEYNTKQVFPPADEIFTAFHLTPLSQVKVVIIGQDPYHNVNQAHGLCFSVLPPTPIPPSLVNIYKEIEADLGHRSVTNGDLTHWARQGVLLLNSTLTVQAHMAASHAGHGWEEFTDAVIRVLAERKNIVYMLWGGYAQKKAKIVDDKNNLVLKCAHPSPLSVYRGFAGCRHFSRANEYLVGCGKTPIEW